tara:strand:- start:1871 stop:2578 length:708 start_codon:yes stop_codon:yes gene_type:complete
MDIIFPEYEEFHTKVAFYRIPKNASTSIYDHLGYTNLILHHIEDLTKKVDYRVYRKTFDPSHVKPDEFKDLIVGENLKDLFSFCVVRNPWDRAVSMYLHAVDNDFKKAYGVSRDLTFDFFCHYSKERMNDPNFIGTHKQVEWTQGKYPPKTILRFENINDEFSNMVKYHNLVTVGPTLPHKNKTNHTHYSDYYNIETKKLIAQIFEEDIDTFNYSFNQKGVDCPEPKGQQGSLRI